ncbi:hypothetical protein, partial [Paramesorhizobium deserti]
RRAHAVELRRLNGLSLSLTVNSGIGISIELGDAMHPDVTFVLERVQLLVTDDFYETDRRSLLHAYIACLSLPDLCTAISASLDAPIRVRLALRRRLLRVLADESDDVGPVVKLVESTAVASDRARNLRRAADALHSEVFAYLPPNSQQMLLERWVDRGGRGAMARWIKAVKAHQIHFSAPIALSYWRASGDFRAAQALAYQAPSEFLRAIIPELVARCDEGWIIAKAMRRCGDTTTEVWEDLRQRHPATYLYICAHMGRIVSDEEALELVHRCKAGVVDNERGLAIWAIGQMRKVAVLDRIVDVFEVLKQRD